MSRALIATFLSIIAYIYAINRPVYKIVLTQKGYAQFIQYDVETPPLREFTICTWIRVYDLLHDQNIFTYVANGNNRLLRLWLDSGGNFMKISINGEITSEVQVHIVKDVWRHICLSYQSDFGAWALYVDSRLVSCEAVQSLNGFVLPGGGSVIIGYGTADNGATSGLEGEIFGANMILSSTIERNITMKINPLYGQKQFPKNKLKKDINDVNYVVLSDLLTDEIQNNFEKSNRPLLQTISKNYVKYHTPHSFVEHSVGKHATTGIPEVKETSYSHEIFDFADSDYKSSTKDKPSFWNPEPVSKPRFTGKYKTQTTKRPTMAQMFDLETRTSPMVSEYETPPPPPPSFYFDKPLATADQHPATESIYKLKNTTLSGQTIYKKFSKTELPEYETPPPEDDHSKVYGQWTSSKFAGTVLNYLKSIKFKNKEHLTRKVPQTIPLYKLSDSHPYSSDFRLNIIRPPSQFKRRKIVEKRYEVVKRDPQINVKILEDDIRSTIIKTHAETQPRAVEVTNRGQSNKEKRFYRNAPQYKKNIEEQSSLEDYSYQKPFTLKESRKKNHRYYFAEPTPSKLRTSVLPFLKSLEHLMRDPKVIDTQTEANNKDMYTRSLSQANKWHNVKSYSNDYTPRKVNMDSMETESDRKKQYPAIRLNYIHKDRDEEDEENRHILNGRKLAMRVSNQSSASPDSVSILKYNNGVVPTKYEKIKMRNNINYASVKKRRPTKRNMDPGNFDKRVKLGNALNERHVIGNSDEQKKKSFVGGNEKIPDINRYRSESNENVHVSPSLGPRVCKNVELYDRVLYVQQDESIDMTHILSPVREKNIAIEFVILNYKKCSLADSSFENSSLLFIDWSKTPVRLFGGSYPKTTTDLCGFF